MQIHVPSAILGIAAASVVLLSMGQAPPPVGPPRIEYGPNPRDMVQIREGMPYVVPIGRRFVLTGLGNTSVSGYCALGSSSLLVNGQVEVTANVSQFGGGTGGGAVLAPSSVESVPIGFTVSEAAVITLASAGSQHDGRAWGYLANQ